MPTELEVSSHESRENQAQLLSRFCSLFPYRLDSMVRSLEGANWRSSSHYFSLSDQDIGSSIAANARVLRAVRSDDSTSFSAMTIRVAPEKAQAVIALLGKALSNLGIKKPCFYRESGSDNLQIFIWWTAPVKASELDDIFTPFLVALSQRVEIKSDIFPGPLPLTLPLQPGFAWLDDSGEIERSGNDLSTQEALAALLQDRSECASDWQSVRESISSSSKQISEPLDHAVVLQDLPDPTSEIAPIDKVLNVIADIDDSALQPGSLLEVFDQLEDLTADQVQNSSLAVIEDLEAVRPVFEKSTVPAVARAPSVYPTKITEHGAQLLLFADPPAPVECSTPEDKPKRRKKARSSLSEDEANGASSDKSFATAPPGILALPEFKKEVFNQ